LGNGTQSLPPHAAFLSGQIAHTQVQTGQNSQNLHKNFEENPPHILENNDLLDIIWKHAEKVTPILTKI
jgi:hypothetical protein